jgi:hypothetical protein
MQRCVGRALAAAVVAILGCGGTNSPPDAAACGPSCMDAIAVRALRDAIKNVYNVALQARPVGAQDQTLPCLLGGMAHVYGEATSNADQGATTVSLTYDLTSCAFSETDTDPNQTFKMTLSGRVTESGTIAVQPSSTTALRFGSDAVTFSGTVYSPPIPYQQKCAVALGQTGNDLSGTLCSRTAGLAL